MPTVDNCHALMMYLGLVILCMTVCLNFRVDKTGRTKSQGRTLSFYKEFLGHCSGTEREVG